MIENTFKSVKSYCFMKTIKYDLVQTRLLLAFASFNGFFTKGLLQTTYYAYRDVLGTLNKQSDYL